MFTQHYATLDAATVVFLHMFKGGGTSLVTIAHDNYPLDAQLTLAYEYPRPITDIRDDFRKLTDDQRRRIRFFDAEHYPFGVHRWLQRPVVYVTMLRDPVERLISEFYYLLQKEDHVHHSGPAQYANQGWEGLIAYAESREVNRQTKQLGGVREGQEIDDEWIRSKVTEETLERAKRNLEQIAIVGVLERFPEMLRLCHHVLGWRYDRLPRTNVTQNRPAKRDVPADVLKRLEQTLSYDQQLYDDARSLFERRLVALDEFLSQCVRIVGPHSSPMLPVGVHPTRAAELLCGNGEIFRIGESGGRDCEADDGGDCPKSAGSKC